MQPMRAIWPHVCGGNSRPVPGALFNGHREQRLPGLINVSFPGIEGESLITGLADFALSSGSACSSATREPSYVLRSLGRSTELAQSSLRLSLGRFTTAADVDAAATAIRSEVGRLRDAGWHARAGRAAVSRAGLGGPAEQPARPVPEPAGAPLFPGGAEDSGFSEGDHPPDIRQGRAGKQGEGTRSVSSCILPTGL